MMKDAVRTALVVLACEATASAQTPAGQEFRINSYTTGLQAWGSPAMALNGEFVIAWMDVTDGDFYGIVARRYDARGVPIGAEFAVNTTTTDVQVVPRVAMDARGNFVVVWGSDATDGSQRNVLGQRYDAAGARRGGEFQANSFTTGQQIWYAVAMDGAGNFVVTWMSPQDGSSSGVYAQRYDASGGRAGGEFRVNTYTTDRQGFPNVAMSASGQFVIAWNSRGQDGNGEGVFGQRYDAGGNPIGIEFQANTYTTGVQGWPDVGMAGDGSFVVAWYSVSGGAEGAETRGRRYDASGNAQGGEFAVNTYTPGNQYVYAVTMDARGNFIVTWDDDAKDGSSYAVAGRRFRADGSPRGDEFQVNTYTTDLQRFSRMSSDAVGNFTVGWASYGQDGSSYGTFAQRFGGLVPAALAVDTGGNRVLEPGETVDVRPSWRNVNGAPQAFAAGLSNITGPTGATYAITDGAGDYGTVADGATAPCIGCYGVSVSDPATRPATHWDASAVESITPDVQGQQKQWLLHVGRSFTDVPTTSGFYRFIETLLHHGVTGGCSTTQYCPATSTTRAQMAVFVLVAKEGPGYAPPACTAPMFADVPASNPFCRWIEELARRAVVGGCGGGNYCPGSAVTREQMAVFVLRTLDPALNPPACTVPMYNDVPPSSGFCRWIEELTRRSVVTGCGGGNYCPAAAVTREQMGVFISATFGLALYGP